MESDPTRRGGQDGALLRHLSALAVAAAVLGPVPVASAQASPDQLVIDGRGFGHGVGMPQDGAYSLAVAGADVDGILARFYPGTSLGRRGGTVRAELLESPKRAVVIGFPSGGELRAGGSAEQSPGFPVTVSPGGTVRVSFDGGRYHAFPLDGATAAVIPTPAPEPAASAAAPAASPTTTTTLATLLGLIPLPPPPTTTPPPPPTTVAPPPTTAPEPPSEPTADQALRAVPADGGSVAVPDLGRQYRGTVEVTAAGGGVQLVNHLDVEEYLRGMGEVLEPGWPAAALQAQAIAARTYALDATAAGRPLCTSQLCQVYLGQTAEYGAMNRAVADTAGQVLTYHGSLAEAVYSANGGGVTATPEEGFGLTDVDYPYLTAAPYPTSDPVPWQVEITWTDLAARVGYPGQASGARVSRAGPSGRALEVTVDGDAGPYAVDGLRFADELGLRSTLFDLRAGGDGTAAGTAAARSATGSARLRRSPRFLEAGVGEPSGRAAWTAAAVLLLAAWATAARALGRAGAIAPIAQGRRRTRDGFSAPAV